MCAIFGVLDFQGKLTPAQRCWLFRELARKNKNGSVGNWLNTNQALPP